MASLVRPALDVLLLLATCLVTSTVAQVCPHGCSCPSTSTTIVQCDPTRQPSLGDRPWVFNSSFPSPIARTAANLFLKGNKLLTLRSSDLSPLTELIILDVSFNALKSLPADSFYGLSKLEQLNLANNNLRTLPSGIFNHTKNLTSLDLSNNWITGLPADIFNPLQTSALKLDFLSGNFFTCDCTQAQLLSTISVDCYRPLNLTGQDSQVVFGAGDPLCSQPAIINPPQASVVNTTEDIRLHCNVSGAPEPTVTWHFVGSDGTETPVVLDHVHTTLTREWSLVVTSAVHNDSGSYRCSATNILGNRTSNLVSLKVLEITCFDQALSSHETDTDCGGKYCTPCPNAKRCLVDSDCISGHVCLGHHTLLSGLSYMSKNNDRYLTCGVETIPPDTLARRLRGSLRGRVDPLPSLNATASLQSILDEVHRELAVQLNVGRSTMSSFRLQAVERYSEPLYRLEFAMSSTSVRTALEKQLHDGRLGGTLTFREDDSAQLTL